MPGTALIGVQAEAPSPLKVPAAQPKHVSEETAPMATLQVPAPQSWHDTDTSPPALYLPASQEVQAAVEGALEVPAAQQQGLRPSDLP